MRPPPPRPCPRHAPPPPPVHSYDYYGDLVNTASPAPPPAPAPDMRPPPPPPPVHSYDYYGDLVNTASRIESCCHGGQIVISAALAEMLLQNRRGLQYDSVDLGPQELRGLKEPLWLTQVVRWGRGLPVVERAARSGTASGGVWRMAAWPPSLRCSPPPPPTPSLHCLFFWEASLAGPMGGGCRSYPNGPRSIR